MKTTLRLALPRLRELFADTVVPFALLDRDHQILRSGELAVHELAPALTPRSTQAILHAEDSVQVRVTVPPLSGARMEAAIIGIAEPLTLSAPESLALAHSPREPDGLSTIAWTERESLARAWKLLASCGLANVLFYPAAMLSTEAGIPESGTPGFWQQPAPAWSLNPPALRPAASSASHWRGPLAWTGAAAAVWLIGLNVHASRIADESARLRHGMQQQVAQAFPDIPVVLDPLKQATQRRDALRAGQGAVSESDFMPLALAAAQLLPDTRNRLQKLDYERGALSLALQEDDASTAAPDARPIEQAAAQGLLLARNDEGWRLERLGTTGDGQQAATSNNAPGRLRIRQQGRP